MNISSISDRFTPISLPDSPTLIGSHIQRDRLSNDNISSDQDGVIQKIF
jgi:hypothetical protein